VAWSPGRSARRTGAAPAHVATVRGLIFDRLQDGQRTAFEEACTTILRALSEQT